MYYDFPISRIGLRPAGRPAGRERDEEEVLPGVGNNQLKSQELRKKVNLVFVALDLVFVAPGLAFVAAGLVFVAAGLDFRP